MTRLRSGLAALALTVVVPLEARATPRIDLATVASITIVSDTGRGVNRREFNPIYTAGGFGAGSQNASVVNLWFDYEGPGTVINGACTGTMLNARQILTAAHCVSDGTSVTKRTFTARFRAGPGPLATDWIEVRGDQFAVKPEYTGQVIEENDLAILTLSADAPTWAVGRELATGPALVRATIGGYGRFGVLGTNTSSTTQSGTRAIVRSGWQQFETTCQTGGACATRNDDFANFGGVLLADADLSGESANGFLCAELLFCTPGFEDFMEVGVSFGDSGSAAVDEFGRIIGVASWTNIINGEVPVGASIGYACVAFVVGNAACQANFNWVQAQVVPEPSTYALLATGLAGLVVMARRRRRA